MDKVSRKFIFNRHGRFAVIFVGSVMLAVVPFGSEEELLA